MNIETANKKGYSAIFITMFIWAGFALSIRAIRESPLTTADVALLRFGIPSLLLLPFVPRRWATLRAVKPIHALMILVGSGLPFFFSASIGGSSTSAAHVGALIPGAAPIFVMLFAYVFYAQKTSIWKILSLTLVVIGVIALLWFDLQNNRSDVFVLEGSAILLGASSLWAIYTLGLRKAGIDAIGCAILLCIPSFVLLTTLVLCGVLPTHFGQFNLSDAMPFILVQGLGVGVFASITYGYAIQHIGAGKSATIGSLTPAVASLLAIPLLGEALESNTVLGIFLITLGVFCSTLNSSLFKRQLDINSPIRFEGKPAEQAAMVFKKDTL